MWARGGKDDGAAAEDDLALFGVEADQASEWVGVQNDSECFEVYPENWEAFQVFMSASTQWRWTGGMQSMRDGLDYQALDLPFMAVGVKKKRRIAVFKSLQVMERAALEVWRKDALKT